MIRICCFAGFLFFASCKSNDKKAILPPETMQKVFWDYIKADAYVANYVAKDSSQNPQMISAKLQQQIFDKYKITKDQFDKSLAYYSANEKEFLKITDSISAINQRDQWRKFVPGDGSQEENRPDSIAVKKKRIKRLNLDSPLIKKPNINKKLYE